MKKKIYGLLALTMMLALSMETNAQSFHERYFREGSWFFDDMLMIRQAELFTTYKQEFGLGADDQMVATNNVVDDQGKFTTKYELHHKGIPVEGSMMNVIGVKGIAQYANGFLLTGLDIDNNNVIGEDDAVANALEYIGAELYPWQDSAIAAGLEAEGDDVYESLYPHADLLITKRRGEQFDHNLDNYQLCYKVVVNALQPASITNVFVNANTGEIFTSESGMEHDYTAVGTVWTWYNGLHNNIKTRSCGACFNFWLHDVDRNIYTTDVYYNPWNKGSYNKDNNNMWAQYTSETHIRTAASAHWGLERAWEYYINRHGRWGTNYAGKRVHVQTRLNMGGANAGYNDANGNDNIYLSPDGSAPGSSTPGTGYSMAALDVMGHEYNHGMVRASSALGTLGDLEAKALNEGYSDIFGMNIERYSLGYTDWRIGEGTGWLVRHLDNPHFDIPSASPEIYQEPGYWNSSMFHNAGGVIRKWFYLTSQGGTFNGQTISPLGIETATDIAYITYNWWLWSNVRYPEAASQTVHATVAHWGWCSNEHKQVVRALRAVGFNLPYPFCFKIRIDGPHVLEPAVGPVMWEAKLNDIKDGNGTYEWHIPEGWQATAEGSTLTLNGHATTESKELSVTYHATDGTVSSDTIIVHFSDVDWQPTSNMPSLAQSSQFEETVAISDHLSIYPNPANTEITVSIGDFNGQASMEIYDINGRVIKTITATNATSTVDVSGLTDGLYLIKVISGAKTYTEKLSIIH